MNKMVLRIFSFSTLLLFWTVSITFTQTNNSETGFLQKLSLFVTDKGGKLVTDIQNEDISLKVNGVKISDFVLEKEIAPLIYVLSVDNSGSMRFILDNVISSSKNIINGNNSKDLTLLMRFVDTKNIQISNRFTSNKSYLHKL